MESKYTYCDFNYCSAPDANLQLIKDKNTDYLSTIYPTELRLHIDNLCSLKCIMCRNDYIIKFQREKEFKELLIPRITSMCKNAERIFMNGNGEVLFSPLAKELIQSIIKINNTVKFDFRTNGMNFTPQYIKALNLEDKIEHISFSMHARKERTYKKICLGGNFKKLLQNIEYAKSLIEKNILSSVTLNFVVNKYNYKEIIDFQNFALKNKLEVFYSSLNYLPSMPSDIIIDNENLEEFNELVRILKNPLLDNYNVSFDNRLLEIKNINIVDNKLSISQSIIKRICKIFKNFTNK